MHVYRSDLYEIWFMSPFFFAQVSSLLTMGCRMLILDFIIHRSIISMNVIGHFRITFGLFFKASPGAHLFIWKLAFIHMQMKTNFHMKRWAPRFALKKRPKVIRKWPIYWVPFLHGKPLVKNSFFGSFPKHALRWWISKVRTWIWSEKSTCSTCRCYGFMIRFWISPTKTQNTFLHFLRKTHSPKNKATPRRHSLLPLLFLENKRCRYNEVGCERI